MTLLKDPSTVGDLTEEILTYLETSDARPDGARHSMWYDNIQEFDGAFTLDELSHCWSGVFDPNKPDDMPISNAEMADPMKWPVWPVDTTWCNPLADFGAWAFHRIRTCSPKEARGRATLVTPRMVSAAATYISKDGIKTPTRLFYAFAGGRWTLANKLKGYKEGMYADNDLHYDMNMAFTFSLTRRYAWSVCLGFDGPSIRFLTDPVGVREAFRLRDVPPGKDRREALRHWVKAHSRKNRKDPNALAEVRKHLRGATKFTWNGLRCQIEPSLMDQEEASP